MLAWVLTEAIRPTRELAGVIMMFVLPLGDLTVKVEGGFCALSSLFPEAQPTTTPAMIPVMASSRRKRFELLTAAHANESACGCHWSFRRRHLYNHAIEKLEEMPQAANGESLVVSVDAV